MENFSYNDSELETHDGLKLHIRKWDQPGRTAKADIAFVHGFFEHSGRYAAEANFFNKSGYNFLTYDQRSHGLSEGKYRSYVGSFQNYERDYAMFLKEQKLGEDRPYFLFAHSMGGLVQCTHLIQNNTMPSGFKGAIFSAPLLSPDPNTSPLLQKIARLVGTLLPQLKVVSINHTAVSRDQKEIEKYLSDPLNYTEKMYAASGYNLLKQMKYVQTKLAAVKHPFLVLHGTDDKLSDIKGSKLLYKLASSEDKEIVILQDFKHEITKDLDHQEVLDKILSWIELRLNKKA